MMGFDDATAGAPCLRFFSLHDKRADSHKLLGPLLASRVHLPNVSGEPERGSRYGRSPHKKRQEKDRGTQRECRREGGVSIHLPCGAAVAK